ncbi:MAG: nucleotidyltransferase [Gaiellaceae bacterium]
MEKLEAQFDGALTRIEISGPKRDRAVKAHEEIRSVLEADPKLKEWGIVTALIGSYARHTGIYPGKDVDVFAKLTALNTRNAEPGTVYGVVRDVLVAYYGDRVKAQSRSIKVDFDFDGDGFSVDVVPAVRMGERWAIPRHNTELWLSANIEERWVETDPERLADLTLERNKTPTVGTQGAYVPTVKLLRQARKHHLDDRKPGGFYFEILGYWAFEIGAVSGDCFAEIFAKTLRVVATQLASGGPNIDPVLGRPYRPAPEPADVSHAARVFAGLATNAEEALRLERCQAALRWRQILGNNDRGPCFEFPPGCDERGQAIKRVRAVAAVGSEEAGSFAGRDS